VAFVCLIVTKLRHRDLGWEEFEASRDGRRRFREGWERSQCWMMDFMHDVVGRVAGLDLRRLIDGLRTSGLSNLLQEIVEEDG